MLVRDRRFSPPQSARYRIVLGSEALESRRLLAATPINVAAGLTFAPGLPVAGLATGMGLATTSQTLPAGTVSVSPAPVAMPFTPSSTGPSTTLSPLPNDSETAVAPASEVARPTPGRSDRISNIVEASQIVPILHLSPPEAVEVIPGPEIQALPAAPAPVVPVQQPAEPAEPARPVDPASAPVPKAVPQESKGPMTLEAWDAAIDLVATDRPEDTSAPMAHHAGGAMAAGALLAAWGGWKYGSRFEGRLRRRPSLIATAEAGPEDGTGH